ncbi:MAG: type II toxin-antitoxin system RelE/ParE family toxin [Deltaproteobacteria bacterium]|nr:type II toxin-antitoxin system RelE/ParE family toxin [Deltaproteobacteria bacterium]
MAVFRPDIPPHVADVIRHLPPDLKRSVKQALRSLSSEPFSGEPLLRELEGLRKFRVRRFRIIYEVDREERSIRIFAVGHRQEVYEEVAQQLSRARRLRK